MVPARRRRAVGVRANLVALDDWRIIKLHKWHPWVGATSRDLPAKSRPGSHLCGGWFPSLSRKLDLFLT